MSALACTSGALFASLTLLGFLFKIMHWPGGNIMAVLGIGLGALVFVPSMAKYLYDKK